MGDPSSVQKVKQQLQNDAQRDSDPNIAAKYSDFVNSSPDQVIEGIESDTEVKKSGRTCKTLFYNPNSEEPMNPQFKLPEGSIIHSGKEFGEFLSNPKNKLSDCNCYYVVSNYNNSKFDINNPATYDNAAVYLVIQKGKDVYLTAMKNVDTVSKIYQNLNSSSIVSQTILDKQNQDLQLLKQNMERIIQDYKSKCKYTIDENGNRIYQLSNIPITSIKPTKLNITIGSFNTQRKDGQPVFRNLRDLRETGLGDKPITLNTLYNEFDLGYGAGVRSEDPFVIKNILTMDFMPGSEKHFGFSGKIFFYPKATNTPINSNKIPIMLSERRFYNDNNRIEHVKDIDLTEGDRRAFNLKPFENNYKNGLPNSFLMYIWEMVTGQRRDHYGILPLIINSGPQTLLKSAVAKEFPFLALKQLAYITDEFGANKIVTGYKNPNTGEINTMSIDPVEMINNPDILKAVLYNIQENFHWNTDKNAMQLPVTINPSRESKTQNEFMQYEWTNSTMVNDLINAYNKSNGQIKSLQFFPGMLEFTAKDLGLVETVRPDGTRELVRNWDKDDTDNIPTWCNWMVNHQILQTDLGENAFKNCWLYGEYEPSNSPSNSPSINTPVEAISSPSKETSINDNTVNTNNNKQAKIQPKMEYKFTNKWQLTKPNKQKLNVTVLSKEQVQKSFDKIGQQYLPDRTYFIDIDNEESVNQLIKYNIDPKSITSVPTEIFNKKFKVSGAKGGEVLSTISTTENENKLQIEKSRQWIKENLGLTDNQININDAILKSCSNKEAYGMMSWCADKLQPTISLSEEAPIGTEYHEAFHYVNLLLHNKEQRNTLYNYYRSTHNEDANLTDKEIEEVLAEDYRRWSNIRNNKVKYIFSSGNWFKNIKTLINVWFNNKSVLRKVYKDISNRKYIGIPIDKESLQLFNNIYNNEIQLSIPGINQNNLDNVSEINDPDTYYKICDSLTSIIIQESKIRTKDDINNLKGVDFILQNIQNNLDLGIIDENNQKLVQQVLNNFNEVFQKQVINNLNDLAIRVIDEEQSNNELKKSIDTGEITSDFIFDKASYEISKKLNASFNAKLFFYSIPQSTYVKEKDENGNTIKKLSLVYDPIFQEPTCVPFNDAWNQVLDNLWNIDSYDDLLDKTQKLAKMKPFFAQLYNRFSDPDIGEQTQTQLLLTIKSAKNTFNTISFQPNYAKASDMPREIMNQISDQAGETEVKSNGYSWSILPSDLLRMENRYSKTWSANLFSSELVDKNQDKYKINSDILLELKTKYSKLSGRSKQIIKKYNQGNKGYNSIEDITNDIIDLKQNVIQLLNDVGIMVDSTVLDYYLSGSYNIRPINNRQNIPTYEKFDLLYELLNNKNKSLKQFIFRQLDKNSIYSTDRKISSMWSKSSDFIKGLAVAQGTVYPSPSEFSMVGPNGSLIYPISQNNYASDVVRWINNDPTECDKVLSIPYSRSSFIANSVKNGAKIKLCNFLALKDGRKGSNDSRGYFNINTVEDYISKMVLTEQDNLLFPTMGDKPTWYSISGLKLFHDPIQFDQDNIPSFDDAIIERFLQYFKDEFESIKQYNNDIPNIIAHPELAVKNYHGKIKNGKMDITGNGGYFRYFHNITIIAPNGGNSTEFQLNQFLYEAYKEGNKQAVNDAFSVIDSIIDQQGYQFINKALLKRVDTEIKFLKDNNIILNNDSENLINKLLPNNLLNRYIKEFTLTEPDNILRQSKAIYSLIANHTVNSMMSVKEIEMLFTGDPAYYKWTRLNKNSRLKDIADNLIANGVISDLEDSQKIITESSLDKIKRLSSVLSTGDNLRLKWDNGNKYNDQQSFTVLGLNDNIVKSGQYDYILNTFRNQVRIKYANLNKPVTEQQLEEEANTMAQPYKEINQTDAVVYVSPDMYKHIKRALGEWDNDIASAFDILESDDSLDKLGKDSPWISEKINGMIKPLKMVYFGIHNTNNMRLPIYDKMAIYPLFKATTTGNNRQLYDRMVDKNNPIDMVTFDSAVKVGQRKTYDFYNQNGNEVATDEDKTINPLFIRNSNGSYGNLTTYKQLFKNLRLQLNTDPHKDTDRSLGTQAVKIGISNVVKNKVYGNNKNKSITGQELLNGISECINNLSDIGKNKFIVKYGMNKNNNYSKFYKELLRNVQNSSIDDDEKQELIYCIKNNKQVPLQSFTSRNAFESKLIADIGRMAVDINTPGGSAIQNSCFGWNKAKGASYSQFAYNNGNKLKFINEDGSMDVILSINFFRTIVPQQYQTDYNSMRNWLIEHNIIGEKNGTKSESTGFVYRIPTQGLSSMPVIRVADVLPQSTGDIIVVPDEFTAMTGSDFDVDKLYITTYYYDQDGNKIKYDDSKSINENNEQQITNKLLEYYNILLSDDSNLEQTKGSIDTTTNILKNNVLKYVQPINYNEVDTMYELSPSYQSNKKNDYMSAKGGVAPMALATTNLALTQALGLKLKLGVLKDRYGLNSTNEIYGQDGLPISDWFSAMINAHVDIAKDPYIIDLNVNKATWSMTEFLLRCGKGEITFYFLPQEILKEYAKQINELDGTYGINKVLTKYQQTLKIKRKLYQKYLTELSSNIITPEQSIKYNIIKKYLNEVETSDEQKLLLGREKLLTVDLLRDELDKNSTNNKDFDYYFNQLLVLDCFDQIAIKSNILSNLVSCSQIDTKKYGNTVPQLKNFNIKVNNFIAKFNNQFELEQDTDENPLNYYFDNSFLMKKLNNVTLPITTLLKNQNVSATKYFDKIQSYVLSNLLSRENIGEDEYTYKSISDKDVIKKVNQNLEQYLVQRVTPDELKLTDEQINQYLFGEGNSIANRLSNFKKVISNNPDKFPGLVDPAGNITNRLIKDLYAECKDETDQYNVTNKIKLLYNLVNNDKNFNVKYKVYLQQLLEYDKPNVRIFTKELIKYFYLISNDSGGINNLFKIVPMQYRSEIGYINNIKQLIQSLNNGSLTDLITDIDNPDEGYFPSILINIARNNWYDNRSVNSTDSKSIYSEKNNVFMDAPNKKYMTYFTTYRFTDSKFITVNNKGNDVLYMNIGRVYYVSPDNKLLSGTNKNIFVAIPKLGNAETNDNMFISEYNKDYNADSAFKFNNLPYRISTDDIIQDLKIKYSPTASSKKESSKLQFDLSLLSGIKIGDYNLSELQKARAQNDITRFVSITNQSEDKLEDNQKDFQNDVQTEDEGDIEIDTTNLSSEGEDAIMKQNNISSIDFVDESQKFESEINKNC